MMRSPASARSRRAPDPGLDRDADPGPRDGPRDDPGEERTAAPCGRSRETHFVELGGEGAAERLRALSRALPAGVDAELLASRDQPGLHLLVCRGDGEALAELRVPAAARRWRFGPLEPEARP